MIFHHNSATTCWIRDHTLRVHTMQRVCSIQLSSSISETLRYLGTERGKLLFAVTPIIHSLLIKGSATHCQKPESKLIIAARTGVCTGPALGRAEKP